LAIDPPSLFEPTRAGIQLSTLDFRPAPFDSSTGVKLRDPLDFLSVFQTSTRERYDWINPLAILALGTIGIFFIYSAQLATGRARSDQTRRHTLDRLWPVLLSTL
jgi:hypothetical protein